ncbi:MAG: GntR family transcriptional regulator [Clostridia bacterium]|nr:GntR family transcriptional regulator [Clostridia bacterium]
MNLVIQYKGESPIYEQIYEQIVAQILSGILLANECLPSIRNIAKELNVSVITIKTAYELLEQNQFIYMVAGKGCFVSDKHKTQLNNKKIEIAEKKLNPQLEFYKSLGISKEEFIKLINQLYSF